MGFIIKPIVTEKQTNITGKLPNRVAFQVSPSANKFEIKTSIEKMYPVKVMKVNTMNYRGKYKSRYTKSGVVSGKKASFKKAIVTLKKGDIIDFFKDI